MSRPSSTSSWYPDPRARRDRLRRLGPDLWLPETELSPSRPRPGGRSGVAAVTQEQRPDADAREPGAGGS